MSLLPGIDLSHPSRHAIGQCPHRPSRLPHRGRSLLQSPLACCQGLGHQAQFRGLYHCIHEPHSPCIGREVCACQYDHLQRLPHADQVRQSIGCAPSRNGSYSHLGQRQHRMRTVCCYPIAASQDHLKAPTRTSPVNRGHSRYGQCSQLIEDPLPRERKLLGGLRVAEVGQFGRVQSPQEHVLLPADEDHTARWSNGEIADDALKLAQLGWIEKIMFLAPIVECDPSDTVAVPLNVYHIHCFSLPNPASVVPNGSYVVVSLAVCRRTPTPA